MPKKTRPPQAPTPEPQARSESPPQPATQRVTRARNKVAHPGARGLRGWDPDNPNRDEQEKVQRERKQAAAVVRAAREQDRLQREEERAVEQRRNPPPPPLRLPQARLPPSKPSRVARETSLPPPDRRSSEAKTPRVSGSAMQLLGDYTDSDDENSDDAIAPNATPPADMASEDPSGDAKSSGDSDFELKDTDGEGEEEVNGAMDVDEDEDEQPRKREALSGGTRAAAGHKRKGPPVMAESPEVDSLLTPFASVSFLLVPLYSPSVLNISPR
ncbi:hypothetical protein BD311DRAFT_812244 [Dichomitus squalens]|uniref:Uncharacterized protein n=1 Tax=Dichomitus squalens TaxID=114155 RepID=A0A4Q9M405_9APHY|nr:hypothetical protein BD311DRAFT_812244 [Dichomitus squalens]